MSSMVDWKFAVQVGARAAGAGPVVSQAQADEVVAQLRADAARSTDLVRDYTGLDAPAGTAPVLVVDRRGWVQANADGFRTIIDPVTERLLERRLAERGPRAKDPRDGVVGAVGSRVSGAEVGLLLGYLSGKVLGQFDPFHAPSGRLLLVAPNIVHVEREIGADPDDFRLWVCLHEETHRVQFTAVDWLREYVFAEMMAMTETLSPAGLDETLKRVAHAVRSEEGSLMDAVSTPEQRVILDRITAVMSLLEGHADVVMDGVGPSVIGSVAAIRKSFNQRRGGVGTLDRLLRRLLGMDAKMAQYRDGAAFVRHVLDATDMDTFNRVWESPETLPTRDEIADPAAWLARVP